MFELKTSKEIEITISKRIKKQRIFQNKTQEEFSKKSGVPLSTYKKFENSGKGSFENFLLIMKAFGKENELESILKEEELISPFKMHQDIDVDNKVKRVRHKDNNVNKLIDKDENISSNITEKLGQFLKNTKKNNGK